MIRLRLTQALGAQSVLNSEPQYDSPLSTALLCGPLRDGSDTEVASADDIHSTVENSQDTPKPCNSDDPAAKKPPGEFVTDELEEHTTRFLEEVKGLAKRRREAAAAAEQTGPPPPEKGQRSKRR
jgi:hypothetical protein